MKLKINKACDLSSISVLPPHARRSSAAARGQQASQLWSQPSQQSFSQGLSSQHGMFSQLSQSSLDDVLTNDQRVSSQERENTVKKFSCLAPASYTREDSQTPIRSSTNVVHKWNPASAPDQRCQVSERRIGMMETSLNRFGINLDSVQSDIMQVSRGSKEILMEVEGICQKLVVQDASLQLMNKGQEDIKAGLNGVLKSFSDQLGKDRYEDRFKAIFLELSVLPGKIEASLLKLQKELCSFLTEEMKAMAYNLKNSVPKVEAATVLSKKAMASSIRSPNQESQSATVPSKKRGGHPITSVPSKKPRGCPVSSQRKQRPHKNPAAPPKINVQAIQVTNVDMEGWKSVRKDQASIGQAKEYRIIIDSDEEIDGGFSCLINEKQTDNENNLIDDGKEETERILRKARRRKRMHDNTIIINRSELYMRRKSNDSQDLPFIQCAKGILFLLHIRLCKSKITPPSDDQASKYL